jgi:hypothetical protein
MLRAVFLAIVLCLAPASVALAQAAPQGICVIQSVEGAAEVSAMGAGRRAAEVGVALGRNATLRTEADSRVTLDCDRDLTVVVGPASELQVLRVFEDAPQTFGLRLMQGIAGFLFESSDDDAGVQVRTPSAVAAVRSTHWAMQVTGGASAVFARDGAVFVFGETGTVQLGPGDGVDVSADGVVAPVVQWGQRRIDLFAELLGSDW